MKSIRIAATLALAGLAAPAQAQAPVKIQLPAPSRASASEFGQAVAVAGDLALVSSPGSDQITVFAPGTTVPVQILTPPPPPDLSAILVAQGFPADTPVQVVSFGRVLAASDDLLVTVTSNTAPFGFQPPALPDAIQVFRKVEGRYTLQRQFITPVGLNGAIALVGSLIAIGQITGDGATPRSGTVSLVDLDGRVLATFSPPGLPSGSEFGAALASSGSTLVVGAPGALFDAARVIGGLAFAYDVTGATATLTARLAEPAARATDAFGQSVAVDGAHVLVGSGQGGGAGDLFTRGGTAWRLAQVLPAAKGGNSFGVTVAVSGERAVVATRPFVLRNGQATTLPTRFSDYRQPPGGTRFGLVTRFTAQPALPGTGGNLGAALALQGDVLIAGGNLVDGGLGAAEAFVLP